MTHDTQPQPPHDTPPPGYRDVSIPFDALLQRALWASVALLVLPAIPFVALYGVGRLLRFDTPAGWTGFMVLGVLIALIVLHEVIHAITWVLAGRLSWRAVRFGFSWKAFAPYAHVRLPLRARTYRLGTVMPGLITGVLPALVALATGSGALMLLSLVMISAAAGDVLVLWVIRAVPADTLVIDHPSAVGCYVEVA